MSVDTLLWCDNILCLNYYFFTITHALYLFSLLFISAFSRNIFSYFFFTVFHSNLSALRIISRIIFFNGIESNMFGTVKDALNNKRGKQYSFIITPLVKGGENKRSNIDKFIRYLVQNISLKIGNISIDNETCC